MHHFLSHVLAITLVRGTYSFGGPSVYVGLSHEIHNCQEHLQTVILECN